VTGPVKTGHVSINYVPSHNKSFLRTEKEYLYSVTYRIKPIKYVIKVPNFMAISDQKEKL